MVKPVYGIPTFPLTTTAMSSKGHTLKKIINNHPYREWGPTVNQSGEVIKCDTQTYIVKYIYIKNILRHPFNLAVLRAVCTRAQVKRMRESRLTITGDGDQDPVAYKARDIVPTALLVREQCLRNDQYKAVEGPSTRPIVLSMISGSYFRRHRRLTILEPDQTIFASHLTLLYL